MDSWHFGTLWFEFECSFVEPVIQMNSDLFVLYSKSINYIFKVKHAC